MGGEAHAGTRGATLLWVMAVALLLHFGVRTAQLGLAKQYSIDEFQYAHAAWLVSEGAVPYRDFFEVHHPLLYVTLAPVFLVGGDDPGLLRLLRVAMLALVAWTAWSLGRLNAAQGRLATWLTPLLLLTMLPYTRWATEVRNDTLAFACFAACLACLASAARAAGATDGSVRVSAATRRSVGTRVLLAGVLLGLALWGSQKVLYYGSILPAALVADLVWQRPRGRPCLLVRPGLFVAGFAGVVLAGLGLLRAAGALDDWWHWCFAWAFQMEREHVQVPWELHLGRALRDAWWVALLACGGVVTTLRGLSRSDASGEGGHPDHLLLLAGVAAFVAHASQKAAYPYNLIPLLGLLAVFAGRGAAAGLACAARAVESGRALAPFAAVACGLLTVLLVLRADLAVTARAADHNAWQQQMLAEVAALTDADDSCYDNSGSFVARPHTAYGFYTERTTRAQQGERLAADIPAAIRAAGTVLMVRDRRFETLPSDLQSFLREHFQPWSGDIWLWGRRFSGLPAAASPGFEAVRDDEYFVEPATLLEQGRLFIDGERVQAPVFRLTRGLHTVRWEGDAQPFSILWLPRHGRRWRPEPEAEPRFSVIF